MTGTNRPLARTLQLDLQFDDDTAPARSDGASGDAPVAPAAAWACLPLERLARVVERVASEVGRHQRLPADRCSAVVALSRDAEVRDLNRTWRGLDKPTNVLSFPSPAPHAGSPSEVPRHLGDVILAEETVLREAAELGIPVLDHATHLVVHGVLHLLGFDHETEAEAEAMEAQERRVLAALDVPDPYAGTESLSRSPNGSAPAA